MGYKPHFQNQHGSFPITLDPIYNASWAFNDCWVRVSSWIVDGATNGSTIPDPKQIRTITHKFGNLRTDGPGGGQDVSNAVNHFGVNYSAKVVGYEEARNIISTASPGRFIWVPTDYNGFHSPCDPGFAKQPNNFHAIGVIPGTDRRGKVTVMDPTCHGYKKLPVSEVLNAMSMYSAQHGMAADKVQIGWNTNNPASTNPSSGPSADNFIANWPKALNLPANTIVDANVIDKMITYIDNKIYQDPWYQAITTYLPIAGPIAAQSAINGINAGIRKALADTALGKPLSQIPQDLSMLPGFDPNAITNATMSGMGASIGFPDIQGLVQWIMIVAIGLVLLVGGIYLLRSGETQKVEQV